MRDYAEKGVLPSKSGCTKERNERYSEEMLGRYNFTRPEDAQIFIKMFNEFKEGYEQRNKDRFHQDYQDRERRKEFKKRFL